MKHDDSELGLKRGHASTLDGVIGGGGGAMAPGKRTGTHLPASDPTTKILRGLDAVEAGLAAVSTKHLPAMRDAIAARQMTEAREASVALTSALARIDAELATARRWATVTESAGAASLLAPLEAARDALRAEAAPVLALAPPPTPALPVAAAFDFATMTDTAADFDATEDANRTQWGEQLDAAEAPAGGKVIDARDRFGADAVQRRATDASMRDPSAVQQHAAAGIAGTGAPLPHLDAIQRSFGAHDITGVHAHVGGAAASAADAIGAEAYATGNDVAFASTPSLFVAAHEAAHVVQQRAGVSLLGGVGVAGDNYEQHADAVAETVVRGESAEGMLGRATAGAGFALVQAFGLDQKILDRLNLLSKLKALDTTELKIYVSSSILLAVSSYVSAVEKAELHDAMKTPDHDLSFVILELFFGSLPALARLGNPKPIARVLGLETAIVEEVAATSTNPALFTGALDAAKEVARGAMPSGNSSSDFYDSMKDSANQAAQTLIQDALATDNPITLIQLALAYNYADHHGVAHYLPIVKQTIQRYRTEVQRIGTTMDDDGEYENYVDTEVATIEHQGSKRLALVKLRRSEDYFGHSLDDGYHLFVKWISDEMSPLAETRQSERFDGQRTIEASTLRKLNRNGRAVQASEIDATLAQWMAYGDDHDLWPAW